ncbi:beta-propeller domain-containing protein [Candidatus Woesearchaeota archaeon]|nr:beta-propeller domain-containing protein [Candidatus Woesearchaeota archaeon]
MENKILLSFIALLVFVTACTQVAQPPTGLQTSQELKKFSSTQELRDYLAERASESNYGYSLGGRVMVDMVAESAPMAKALEATDSGAAGGADEYSQTNIQVEGVDEADFVKNDGRYIYVLAQDNLVIVDAYPADDAEILSKTEIDGWPRDLFVNDDRLIVFTQDNDEVYTFPEYSYMPVPRYTAVTHALVYDISDREKPELVNDYSINGNYYQSRMIGDYIYFIVNENVYYTPYLDAPVIRESSSIVVKPEVYYFDNLEDNYNFHTIAAFNVEEDEISAKTFMLGYSNNLYVSQDNIYITYQKSYYQDYRAANAAKFYDAVVPLLPSGARNEIKSIRDDDSLNSYEKWDKISAVMEETYNKMDEDEKEELMEDIYEAVAEYDRKQEHERRKTVIHKISIDKGDIEYKTRGEVSGYLLNQFSMDENSGYFRVATTTYIYAGRESTMYNNVYVLDNDLAVVGKIEEIAPDERIYSTRFIGEKLYMVTFERIDPLFVIDLSDPKNPEVLGELKIPGYSDYLHPYDETHIIGIGKETAENEWGGVSIKGVKLALFDVSDVENPKMVDKYEIGTSGSDSEALHDHKAFLFDKKKGLLVIPVREIKGDRVYDKGYYRRRVWQGAYVFSISEDGFEKKGKISHYEGDEEDRWYWSSPRAVTRALYMDDVLYTVSAVKLKMNDLNDLEEINEVELPYKESRYYPPYYYG